MIRCLSLLLLAITATAQDAPRWTAFHAPPLKAALEPLAEHRRAQGYAVELMEVAPGDPAAYLGKIAAAKDVVLLAGSLDFHGAARADCLLPGGTGKHGRMRGKSSDGALASGAVIGRLPAGTPEELAAMVAKILRFEQEGAAADRGLGCIVGNPMPGEEPVWAVDVLLALQTKSMLAGVNREWRIAGAADLCWKPFPQREAAFPAAMSGVTDGAWEVLAFFGHSDPAGIYSCGTTYRLPASWSAPVGPPRGIFFTCGCHALAHQDAYAVRAIRGPGGPAAVIGASGISYSTMGYLAGKGLTASLSQAEGPLTAGEWWRNVRAAIAQAPMSRLSFTAFDYLDGSCGGSSLADQRKEHLEMWSLLGDPAMRMPRN